MSIYSILSLDLNRGVTTEERNAFYKKLTELKWKKISELSTLWYASWKDDTSGEDIIQTTKKDVDACASISKVSKYDASVAVSGKPVVWTK